jgi:hypothetical protein
MKIFFGTNNAHKLREIQQILGEKFEILSFKDVPYLDVPETEPTLEGNAMLKAKAFFAHTQIPCFADGFFESYYGRCIRALACNLFKCRLKSAQRVFPH